MNNEEKILGIKNRDDLMEEIRYKLLPKQFSNLQFLNRLFEQLNKFVGIKEITKNN